VLDCLVWLNSAHCLQSVKLHSSFNNLFSIFMKILSLVLTYIYTYIKCEYYIICKHHPKWHKICCEFI
jgi:hypothetical protein